MKLQLLTSLGWRQPRPRESLLGAAACSVLSLSIFVFLCYPELRKNFSFLPAQCEPYFDAAVHPEILPYRHCSQSCFGCVASWNPTPC